MLRDVEGTVVVLQDIVAWCRPTMAWVRTDDSF